MTASKMRAALSAILLGTASMGAATFLLAAPAQAQSVRPSVGTPLKEAQSLAAAGNYRAAMAKVNEAEGVAGKTPAENSIINQMKQYVGVKSGDVSIGGAAAAKAKFANDYNARRYADVIADADILKKANALDAASMQIVAQAYYLSGNKAGCVKYIKGNFSAPGDSTLELLMRCAYDSNDEPTQRQALESLVARSGKKEHWGSLLKLSEHAAGMRDHDTLDVNRLKMLTGNVATKDEYTLLAQLALQLGFPAEAQSVLEKGQAAKVLNDDRTTRLLALAKTQAGTQAAGQAKALADANAAPKGDALVKIGEAQVGQGKAADGVATIQAGIKKGVADENDAKIRLGYAQISAGKKADAVKTLDSVKGPAGDRAATIAHLYSLYARR